MKTTIFFTLLLFTGVYCHSQIITTIAGNGTQGYSGDGGLATAATVDRPRGVTVDKMGNVYIADSHNHRIRKVDFNGIITTIAGTGVDGYSGDGGPATAADIATPYYITIDTADNLYIADFVHVRRITPYGVISTVAGNGMYGYSGDGGPATNAAVIANGGIAADRFGNIYFADCTVGYVVRKVDASGIISTVAGNGGIVLGADGVPATSSSIGGVYSIAVDTAANIYLAGFGRVRIVNTSGVISTFAGSTNGYSGDEGPATAAEFKSTVAVIADDFGNVYISDQQSHVVRRVDKDGIIHAFAGTGIAGFSGDGGPATAAEMYTLTYGLGVIGKGAVFITDNQVNERIRAVDHPPYFPAGHTYTVTACADTPYIALDTLLSVMDSNTAQPLLWSIAGAPAHGTLAATDTLRADTIVSIPSGTVYTPSGFYIGTDSFSVVVSDGIMKDTIKVYVELTDCTESTSNIASGKTRLDIYPNPSATGSLTCQLKTAAAIPMHIAITDATGRVVRQTTATTNKPTHINITGPGVYLIQVSTADGSYTRRVVVME